MKSLARGSGVSRIRERGVFASTHVDMRMRENTYAHLDGAKVASVQLRVKITPAFALARILSESERGCAGHGGTKNIACFLRSCPRALRTLVWWPRGCSNTQITPLNTLLRGYMWWSGMDKEIESSVKQCPTCQSTRKMPPTAPLHPWARPSKPWSRVHVDYAGPFEGKMFLLVVDAYSKWSEVHATTSYTLTITIELLWKSFASLGLPEVVVSDNGMTFTSQEFADFMKNNGIRHSPPYHPSSNGLAERALQTLKEVLGKVRSGSLETHLSKFLLNYRITAHSP